MPKRKIRATDYELCDLCTHTKNIHQPRNGECGAFQCFCARFTSKDKS